MLIVPAPLAKLAAALHSGELELTKHIDEVCDRVESVDRRVQALLPEPVRRVRLLNEARRLQERFPDPTERPPLYGILVGVKDIIHIDGFLTRAGSNLPPTALEGPEATVVTTLREAGALILDKTVTTEFAWFDPGPTRNPHNVQHTPGGSSSGSAAAVAAGLCPLALGTQTIGSVIRPAAFCGIVGFKPSFGRIPTDGVIMFSESADHVGLFTQDVAGMRLAAAVVCDGWKVPTRDRKLGGRPVLGAPEGPYLEQASEEGLAAFRDQLQRLEAAGYTVRRVPAFDDIETINQQHRRMIAAEVVQVHADWFARYESLYRPRTAAVIREGQQVSADELAEARAGREVLRSDLEQRMQKAGIVIWVSPAALGPAPRGIDATGDPAMNLPWTYAGLPTVTVPAGGAENGLPLGLQCTTSFMTDERLLAWAESIAETLTDRR
ncbi:MAG: Glutamyl-tRNA(Gln) amidotransferase subunit A [Anaerolineales bacterium]|nr:Glutamyl-tRNA(Gln) amidotransferase subunit A [Anaerolineales bacterium]